MAIPQQLVTEVLKLPDDERAELVDVLLASLDEQGHDLTAEEQAGADYLGGGLATNLFAAAEFNLDLGEIEELQPEQVYSDAVIVKFAENVGG